jgi:hypothetical protein
MSPLPSITVHVANLRSCKSGSESSSLLATSASFCGFVDSVVEESDGVESGAPFGVGVVGLLVGVAVTLTPGDCVGRVVGDGVDIGASCDGTAGEEVGVPAGCGWPGLTLGLGLGG